MIREGDGETAYAYFALLKFGIRPVEFIDMPLYEKAVIAAFAEKACEERYLNS